MKKLERFAEPAYALLRIAAGLMFFFHGLQKIVGVYSTFHPAIGSQVWVAGLLELVGGVFIAAGKWTRCAAFVCSGEMAVAYVQFHWKLQWGANFFPGVNKGEMALLYCLLFLYVACKGPGIWSLDKR